MKPENVKCPECGGEMTPRSSKFGKFWGCKDYPKCKGTRDSMGMSKKDREQEQGEDEY
jgi:DNA topoisomerase-1